MTGCPVGAAQGWEGQEVSVVEYSQQYPKASTHIENSHLLHMSTHLRFLVVHTPAGQENALDFNTNQLVIPLFISVLKKLGGGGGVGLLPFPTHCEDTLLFTFLYTRRSGRNPTYFL